MKILDMSAGNRAIWYNKNHPMALYIDKRESVKPDLVANTCDLNMIENGIYDLIVFDPPHLNCGKNSNMSKVYGYHTTKEILETIEGSAKEAHRVSKQNALMALKWNCHSIRLQRVFDLMPQWEPLFGALTKNGPGAKSKTYWCMMRRL
jgi:hypothetical protein